MGTCCEAHLTTKIRKYIPNAQNGSVTVQLYENPHNKQVLCDYCKADAVFSVSFFSKVS